MRLTFVILAVLAAACTFERPADVPDNPDDAGDDAVELDAPPIDGPPVACTEEGATQPCGTTEEGECTFGVETCTGGVWVDCTAVLPTTELCNGLDDDCMAGVPVGEANGDGDPARLCDGDCDDSRADVYPGAPELCDGRDNDCADGIPANEADADGDNVRVCQGDCNDANPNIHPGAPELCNGIDDDCAGGVPANEANADGDAYRVCQGDCNDANPNIHPGATEICNGVDDNCVNGIDEGTFGSCTIGACAGTRICSGGNLVCARNNPQCDPDCGICTMGCCHLGQCVAPCP